MRRSKNSFSGSAAEGAALSIPPTPRDEGRGVRVNKGRRSLSGSIRYTLEEVVFERAAPSAADPEKEFFERNMVGICFQFEFPFYQN